MIERLEIDEEIFQQLPNEKTMFCLSTALEITMTLDLGPKKKEGKKN